MCPMKPRWLCMDSAMCCPGAFISRSREHFARPFPLGAWFIVPRRPERTWSSARDSTSLPHFRTLIDVCRQRHGHGPNSLPARSTTPSGAGSSAERNWNHHAYARWVDRVLSTVSGALDQALQLFWRHGYEATSLKDLTETLGVTPPSIYSAFKDKKTLFRESVGRYLGGPVTFESIIDEAATAQDAAGALLRGAVVRYTGSSTPSGCLLATAAISCSDNASDIQNELATIREGVEKRLRIKISKDVELGAASSKNRLRGAGGPRHGGHPRPFYLSPRWCASREVKTGCGSRYESMASLTKQT